MREIYLKPFEEAVKANLEDGGAANGNPLAIMSSYNYIGATWAAACSELQKTVLRDEWGFRGMVLSDYFGNYGYMDADRAIRGGTDIMLGTTGNEAILTDQTSATSIEAMKLATKNVLFTTVNSAVYDNYTPGQIPGWLMTSYIIEGAVVAVLAICEILLVRGYLKKKKAA